MQKKTNDRPMRLLSMGWTPKWLHQALNQKSTCQGRTSDKVIRQLWRAMAAVVVSTGKLLWLLVRIISSQKGRQSRIAAYVIVTRGRSWLEVVLLSDIAVLEIKTVISENHKAAWLMLSCAGKLGKTELMKRIRARKALQIQVIIATFQTTHVLR